MAQREGWVQTGLQVIRLGDGVLEFLNADCAPADTSHVLCRAGRPETRSILTLAGRGRPTPENAPPARD